MLLLSVMFCKSFGVTWYVIASVFVLLMIFSSYIIGLWDVFFSGNKGGGAVR